MRKETVFIAAVALPALASAPAGAGAKKYFLTPENIPANEAPDACGKGYHMPRSGDPRRHAAEVRREARPDRGPTRAPGRRPSCSDGSASAQRPITRIEVEISSRALTGPESSVHGRASCPWLYVSRALQARLASVSRYEADGGRRHAAALAPDSRVRARTVTSSPFSARTRTLSSWGPAGSRRRSPRWRRAGQSLRRRLVEGRGDDRVAFDGELEGCDDVHVRELVGARELSAEAHQDAAGPPLQEELLAKEVLRAEATTSSADDARNTRRGFIGTSSAPAGGASSSARRLPGRKDG